VLAGRRAAGTADLDRACPICGAARGWHCTKTVGAQVLPRKKVHPERTRRIEGHSGRIEPVDEEPRS
jgi:hypothetical protein